MTDILSDWAKVKEPTYGVGFIDTHETSIMSAGVIIYRIVFEEKGLVRWLFRNEFTIVS